MTVKELKEKGYVNTDIKYQRGYVSRKNYNPDIQTVYTAGGKRKGDKYYLVPCYNSTQYCYRQYIKKGI